MPDKRMYGEPYRNICLCVDSYERGNPVGRFYHPGIENGGGAFYSLTQFLARAETLFDEMNFPQSFTAKRSFTPLYEMRTDVVMEAEQSGKLATFTIRILFRQHASWQGSVTWIEGKGEQSFRSALELIFLLDSALGGCEDSKNVDNDFEEGIGAV